MVVYQIYPRSFKDTDGDGVGTLTAVATDANGYPIVGAPVEWISDLLFVGNGYRWGRHSGDTGMTTIRTCPQCRVDLTGARGFAPPEPPRSSPSHRRLRTSKSLVVTSPEHAWSR